MKRFLIWQIFLVVVFFHYSAYACITTILDSPKRTQPFLSDQSVSPSNEQKELIEEFKRDKKYYDALVSDYCTMRLDTSPMSEKQKIVNQEIRGLLLEKWKESGEGE